MYCNPTVGSRSSSIDIKNNTFGPISLKEQLKGGKNLILQILSSFYVIYKAIRSIHPLYFPPGSTQPCLLMLRHCLIGGTLIQPCEL